MFFILGFQLSTQDQPTIYSVCVAQGNIPKKDTFMLLLDLDISQNRPFVFLNVKLPHVCVCMFRFANIRAVTSGMSACIGMAMHVAVWCQRKPCWSRDERVWIMSWREWNHSETLFTFPTYQWYRDILIFLFRYSDI